MIYYCNDDLSHRFRRDEIQLDRTEKKIKPRRKPSRCLLNTNFQMFPISTCHCHKNNRERHTLDARNKRFQ